MSEKELPAGWVSVRLSDVLSEPLINGRSVRTLDGGFPVLRLTSIKDGAIDLGESKEGSWSAEEAKPYLVTQGDYLLSRGNGSRKLVGRGGLVGDVAVPIAFPDTMVRVRVNPEIIIPKYLGRLWDSLLVRRQIESLARTTAGIYKVNQKMLEGIRLPLPPLAEQGRIVEALEGHLSHLVMAGRNLRDARARVQALMVRIMATQFGTEDAKTLRLSDVAEVRLGRQRSPKNHAGDSMRPYLRAANVGWKGLILDDVKKMNFTDKELEAYRLEKNDIVLSEASGSPGEVGKPAMWSGEIEDCCFQNTLIRVRSKGINPHYLLYFLRCSALRGDFRAGARGVGIHHLGAAKLSSWSIPVPSGEDQARIVDVLDTQLSALTAASEIFEGNRNIERMASALRSAILNRAFTGNLVPQDPTDEPASALLARIQAERAAQPKAKRTRRTPATPRKVKKAPAAAPTESVPAPSPTAAPTHAVQQEFDL
ncbi:restriction endonuclease subunit S [Streptomyces sp. ITFR-16]|uniref:restriction endonuclease subunit S n=1 Tax=Streptomyces sp. ITFR-16 TaxID=3075198 RepID=UPI00288AAB68|nr:restriction endonuclease subunit S [Streptomyces sp. ITFR-16]WNI24697.1 restriction endonuclease subunit S [Streptomyces sp. ITFR-16]